MRGSPGLSPGSSAALWPALPGRRRHCSKVAREGAVRVELWQKRFNTESDMFLRLLPAALSLWLLAAHFLRGGHVLLAAALAAAPAALFIRSPATRRMVQAALAAGTLIWLTTAVRIGAERQEDGRPWARMAFILVAVASVNVAGAALLQTRAAAAWYDPGAPSAT